MMLFPQLPPDNVLRVQAEEQHFRLHRLAENCIIFGKTLLPVAEELANQLEENIRFEERILFPYLQKFSNENEGHLN